MAAVTAAAERIGKMKNLALFTCLISGTASAAPAINVVCSLVSPVVSPDGRVSVTVLVDAPARARFQYQWNSAAGKFDPPAASAPTVEWRPDGAAPGSYTLLANVAGPDGAAGGCELSVLVTQEVRSAGGEPGGEASRALLVMGTDERKGYGLYSYILFGSRPDAAAQARYEAVLRDYLTLEDVRLEKDFKLVQLNVTYVPVTADPPDADNIQIDWVIKHYDYARARALLASLKDRPKGYGPFIISALQPLQGPGSGARSYLSQDLSTVPVSVIPLWMKQFRSETTQQRVWEGKSIDSMALNLRTWIAVAAEGAPMVQQAVKALIAVVPSQ